MSALDCLSLDNYSTEVLCNAIVSSPNEEALLLFLSSVCDRLIGLTSIFDVDINEYSNSSSVSLNVMILVNGLNSAFQFPFMATNIVVLKCIRKHSLELCTKICSVIQSCSSDIGREIYIRHILSQYLCALVHDSNMESNNVVHGDILDILWKLTTVLFNGHEWNGCSMVLSITIKYINDLIHDKVEFPLQKSKKSTNVKSNRSPLSTAMTSKYLDLIRSSGYYDIICNMLLHSNPVIRK